MMVASPWRGQVLIRGREGRRERRVPPHGLTAYLTHVVKWSGTVTHDAPHALKFACRISPDDPVGLIAACAAKVRQMLFVDHAAERRRICTTLLTLYIGRPRRPVA